MLTTGVCFLDYLRTYQVDQESAQKRARQLSHSLEVLASHAPETTASEGENKKWDAGLNWAIERLAQNESEVRFVPLLRNAESGSAKSNEPKTHYNFIDKSFQYSSYFEHPNLEGQGVEIKFQMPYRGFLGSYTRAGNDFTLLGVWFLFLVILLLAPSKLKKKSARSSEQAGDTQIEVDYQFSKGEAVKGDAQDIALKERIQPWIRDASQLLSEFGKGVSAIIQSSGRILEINNLNKKRAQDGLEQLQLIREVIQKESDQAKQWKLDFDLLANAIQNSKEPSPAVVASIENLQSRLNETHDDLLKGISQLDLLETALSESRESYEATDSIRNDLTEYVQKSTQDVKAQLKYIGDLHDLCKRVELKSETEAEPSSQEPQSSEESSTDEAKAEHSSDESQEPAVVLSSENESEPEEAEKKIAS